MTDADLQRWASDLVAADLSPTAELLSIIRDLTVTPYELVLATAQLRRVRHQKLVTISRLIAAMAEPPNAIGAEVGEIGEESEDEATRILKDITRLDTYERKALSRFMSCFLYGRAGPSA